MNLKQRDAFDDAIENLTIIVLLLINQEQEDLSAIPSGKLASLISIPLLILEKIQLSLSS